MGTLLHTLGWTRHISFSLSLVFFALLKFVTPQMSWQPRGHAPQTLIYETEIWCEGGMWCKDVFSFKFMKKFERKKYSFCVVVLQRYSWCETKCLNQAA